MRQPVFDIYHKYCIVLKNLNLLQLLQHMDNNEKSDFTVTKNNFMEVVRAIIAKDLKLLKDSSIMSEDSTVDHEIETKIDYCSKHCQDDRDTLEWVDAVVDYFKGDRRTFMGMELWIFIVFSQEFLCSSEKAQELYIRLFSSYEDTQRIEDSSHETMLFVDTHFGGSILDFIEAGGSRYMRRWKEENSRVDINEPRDQL